MIAQGSDGLSRGNMLEGVMKGMDMMGFVPLNQSALEVQTNLSSWLESWLPSDNPVVFLTPADWFERGHDISGYVENCDHIKVPKFRAGTFVWAPPPAAADVAIYELRKARHKRQDSLHVFVCPRLMKPWWYKQVNKAADLLFEIKPNTLFWSEDRYEPLIICVCFPFLRFKPWQLRNTPTLLEMARILRKVSEGSEATYRFVLREFCTFTRRLPALSKRMVWKVLHGGYKLSIPYQDC